jgi:hypothetical protein
MRKLKRGIGRVLELTQKKPKAGLAVVAEFFVWGSGWLVWGVWARGFIMLLAWGVFIGVIIVLQPFFISVIALLPPLLLPVVIMLAAFYFFTGIGAVKALLKHFDDIGES